MKLSVIYWLFTICFLLAACNLVVEQGQQPVRASLQASGSSLPLKGAMYWPRKALNPAWWSEFENGLITDDDIRADLEIIKHELNINTVRVFLMYDRDYRSSGQIGFVDGKGTLNNQRLQTVSRFIDLAAEVGLDVMPTFFMEMETEKNGGFNWETLESNYRHHEAYALWLVEMLKTKHNVKAINLKNEPDGFGAWDNAEVASRILTWLGKLKAVIHQNAPHLLIYVNASTFDNVFKEFARAPEGSRSLYQVSDALVFNHFVWADNGFWPHATPVNAFNYVKKRNVLGKPIILTEFGWPAHYNSDGTVVPYMQWDNPFGWRPTTPSTEQMQKRAVEESVYWAEKYDFDGAMLWSAFDHGEPGYREPFGVIDDEGVARPAAQAFARAFTETYSRIGEAPISLADGGVYGGGLINGVHGSTALPGGVKLAPGAGYYSEVQRYFNAFTFFLRARQNNVPSNDGIALGLVSKSGKEVHFRREEWSKVWRIFVDGVEEARSKPDDGLGTEVFDAALTLSNKKVNLAINGNTLKFYKNKTIYVPELSLSSAQEGWRLVAAASTAPVELLEARALGAPKGSFMAVVGSSVLVPVDATKPQPPQVITPNPSNLIYQASLFPSLKEAGWTVLSGQWQFDRRGLVERRIDGFDHIITYREAYSNYSLYASLSHVQAFGGGLVFNMPERKSRRKAHMVRFNDEGTGVFWGYFDESGDFVGQGYAQLPPIEKELQYKLEVEVGYNYYAVRVGGRTLAQNVPLKSQQGYIGLTSSGSVVAFNTLVVLRETAALPSTR